MVHGLPVGRRAHRQPPHAHRAPSESTGGRAMTLLPTPGQTVGPFFGFALSYRGGADLVPPGRPDAVRLFGRVLDGRGQPVPDALLEIRQAGPDGTIPLTPGSLHRD